MSGVTAALGHAGVAVARPSSVAALSRVEGCLEATAALHRHLCPRQVLGVRMALYAGELLGIELPRTDQRVFAFVETDGCFADSVSVATGCWLGYRTLRLVDHGKVAATLTDKTTGCSVRVWPHPEARVRAFDHAADARDRWHAQLRGYQVMPAADLLCAARVTLEIDLRALRSRPGTRVTCAECGEEVINERELVRGGSPLCRGCAGENYYRVSAGT